MAETAILKRVVLKRVGREIKIAFEPGEEFGKLFSKVWSSSGWENWVKELGYMLGYKTYIDLWPNQPLSWSEGKVALPINKLHDALEHFGDGRLEFETPEAAREAFPALVDATKTVMHAVTEHMKHALSNKDETVLEFLIPDSIIPDEDKGEDDF